MNMQFNIIMFILWTFITVWITLYAISDDVAQQLNRSYEIRDENKAELQECHQALGLHYESN